MSNGEFCCAIGLCCPPASASRRSALINELAHGLEAQMSGIDDGFLGHVADWLIANVDMAPKGTLDLSHVADAIRKQHDI
jgi:hypothetical protein